jgi:hypothetical protein
VKRPPERRKYKSQNTPFWVKDLFDKIHTKSTKEEKNTKREEGVFVRNLGVNFTIG